MMKRKLTPETHQPFLYLLTLAYAFSTFASGILMPIYAFFVQKIGGGILETAWAMALYSILTGFGTILIHKTTWSHTYRKHLLWGGWLIWLISMIIYLVMQNVVALYISQILNALGDAICGPVFDAEFSKKIEENLSGGWAMFEGTISISEGIASILGGSIASYYGFEALLYCVITVAMISFLLIAYYSYYETTVDINFKTLKISSEPLKV